MYPRWNPPLSLKRVLKVDIIHWIGICFLTRDPGGWWGWDWWVSDVGQIVTTAPPHEAPCPCHTPSVDCQYISQQVNIAYHTYSDSFHSNTRHTFYDRHFQDQWEKEKTIFNNLKSIAELWHNALKLYVFDVWLAHAVWVEWSALVLYILVTNGSVVTSPMRPRVSAAPRARVCHPPGPVTLQPSPVTTEREREQPGIQLVNVCFVWIIWLAKIILRDE